MIAATLFSGIGAPECAMPHWDWRWCAEIEKFPSAVLRARYPHSVNLGDVNAEDFVERAEKIGRPDVLVFGSPCQDFSVAGRRVGLDGDRGNLALVALGTIKRLRTRWVVFENVPGLLSSRSGSAEAERTVREGPVGGRADSDEDSDFAAFLALVQQCGYLGCYRITDAQYAGVPQRRRRIFAVFHLGDWRPAAAVLFEPEGLRGDHPPSRETGQGVAPTISSRPTGGGGLGTDFDLDGGLDESTVEVVGALAANGDTERKHGFGFGQQDWESGYAVPVAKSLKASTGGVDREDGHTLVVQTPVEVPEIAWALQERDSKDSDTKEGHLIAVSFEPRMRGDDGRSYDREPHFAEVTPAVNTVKPPAVIAFDTTQITHPENRSQPDDRSPQLSQSGHPPTIAFDCKAAGNTTFSIGEQAGALRASHGGGHAAVAFQTRFARNGRGGADELVPALNGADAGATSDMRPCVAVFKPSHFTRGKDGAPSGVSPPLGAEPDKGDQDAVLMTGTAVRRLTPRECERLQAFPDDHTLIRYRGAPAADGPRYKALGNAMNVHEIRWVLERIEKFEREVTKGGE